METGHHGKHGLALGQGAGDRPGLLVESSAVLRPENGKHLDAERGGSARGE